MTGALESYFSGVRKNLQFVHLTKSMKTKNEKSNAISILYDHHASPNPKYLLI